MANGKGWVSLVASIGIGAAAYQIMKPNNMVGNMVKNRMSKMWQSKELFPDQ